MPFPTKSAKNDWSHGFFSNLACWLPKTLSECKWEVQIPAEELVLFQVLKQLWMNNTLIASPSLLSPSFFSLKILPSLLSPISHLHHLFSPSLFSPILLYSIYKYRKGYVGSKQNRNRSVGGWFQSKSYPPSPPPPPKKSMALNHIHQCCFLAPGN